MTTAAPTRPIRVAAYTRKSHAQGLEQEFNSIDAQREAIDAFVTSQRGVGWVALPQRYDDGGFSGANTERPAFQRLLADVAAGKVDCIAVYRIDRLSRNFTDYVALLKLFEQHGVTFISVTEQFNTTTPTGRLVLNQLILFAQFEREIIAERVRDKVRATRRRGAWTGGKPVLGYAVKDKKLVIVDDEAAQVRGIFAVYLEVGALSAAVREVAKRGWRNKPSAAGKAGAPFTKGTMSKLLHNPLYRGLIRCGDEIVPAEHEAIIDAAVWDAVQERLKANSQAGGAKTKNKTGALLRELVRCGRCGSAMVHTFTTRGNKRHRYYVCLKAHNEGVATCPGSRVAAGQFEAFVANQIRALGRDEAVLAQTTVAVARLAAERREQITAELRRLEIELRAASGSERRLVEQRLAELRAEAKSIATVSDKEVRAAVSGFEPVWDALFPAERERILRLLIERVTYHPDSEQVEVDLRPCGITTLAAEASA